MLRKRKHVNQGVKLKSSHFTSQFKFLQSERFLVRYEERRCSQSHLLVSKVV